MVTGKVSVEHPLVDFVGDGFVATITTASLIAATEGFASLVVDAAGVGRRVLLVTGRGSRVTFGLLQLLSATGAAWVVRSSDGALRNALTGRTLASFDDAFRETGTTGAAADPVLPLEPVEAWLQVTASVTHQARDETTLGGTLELLTAQLADAAPVGWGVNEPAGLHWNRANVTRFVRGRMPRVSKIYVAGRGERAMTATVRVSRSARGVTEETKMLVALGSDEGIARQRIVDAPAVLGRLADAQTVLVASAVLLRGRADLSIDPVLAAPPVPVAVVLGPRAVQDLHLDLTDLETRFGAFRAGRPRIPALVVPFTEGDGWPQFVNLAREFSVIDLAKALGLPAVTEGL
ncbi:hypothetical protein E3O25_14660 [Cryobacterium sp. TMT1-3]|uniref:Uncharacterized protein n=1 Tax=Cryobacterium luteum TaxID=1424661 RepID=A0A1H8A557_9MICO|nr:MULTISPECIES: DUF6177 family protein [Cryobacterium]TFB88399.1 hypothetical protein E3O10_11310 [Cryobacterium luteum]TFC24426.1 hypothetical protein E3O25_14660 [Cryobacterium sp. TMT1-3]SEM65875.1 hypothetical protein SAMN05216281_10139 [Cryobacterium luteum]